MAISQGQERQPVDEHELISAFAEMLRHEPSVIQMWVSRHRDVVSFWLLTTPIELAGERRLYHLGGDLFDRFPDTVFHVHLLNPLFYDEFMPEEILPTGAKEIALRVA